MAERSLEVRSLYTEAIAEVGPSITYLSAFTGRTLAEVRRDLEDPYIKALYTSAVDFVLEFMDRHGANMTVLAKTLGQPRHRVEAWIADDPRLRTAFYDFQESVVDIAEHAILRAAQREEPWAVLKILGSRGAGRGWADHTKVDLDGESRRLGVNLHAAIQELANKMAEAPALIDGELAQPSGTSSES